LHPWPKIGQWPPLCHYLWSCMHGCCTHPCGGCHDHYPIVMCSIGLVDSDGVGVGCILALLRIYNNFFFFISVIEERATILAISWLCALTPHLVECLPLKTKQHQKIRFWMWILNHLHPSQILSIAIASPKSNSNHLARRVMTAHWLL
jgi:hypothetical protein